MKHLLKLCICFLMLVGCSGKPSQNAIIVGSKNFTENEILAEIYALALEDHGYKVTRQFDIASSAVHTSITSNEIDLYPEYTGTGYISILKHEAATDADFIYKTVKEEYNEQFSVTWLDYSPANDSQGLAITTKAAKKYGIKTITDLQKHASQLRFASQGEFDEREDGIPGLEKLYGPFKWKSSKIYDNSLKYQVLANDQADVAPVYTTEGQLSSDEFLLLEDDKHCWPPYNVAPIIRNSVLDKHSDIADILNAIAPQLTTEKLTSLNAQVDVDKKDYEDVARDFYESIK